MGKWLLEDGSGYWLLEDASGAWLLEDGAGGGGSTGAAAIYYQMIGQPIGA
jgi:hypothetical protein